ncbi:MAG: family 20 glycosylhydrolase [Bacteroidota bacterium]
MKILNLFAFIATLAIISCQPAVKLQPTHVIPEPVSVTEKSEPPFLVGKNTRIIISDSSMLPTALLLNRILKKELPVVWKNEANAIKTDFVFELDPQLDSLSSEGYILTVSKGGVLVRSAGAQGLFYAVETIRQLLPEELEVQQVTKPVLAAVEIIDSPRFSWRGMHLDVSRHFMPVDFVRKYIDYLAMHKLNVFHWHLVDGIGWRIEIKSHPELTDVGAWRVVKEGNMPWVDFEVWKEGDNRPKYGGFYTQEEIKEVVKYAQERFITVVPEIELPGHSEVVFQCYPELNCKDEHGENLRNIGVYCASNPDSYKLLEDILDEVIELFPSEYIHIGGDEVNKNNWENCEGCKQLMKRKDYTPHELQSHFVNHFDKYLKVKGRKLIGWHEILEGELSESATIMYWGSEKNVADYLKKGHPTVLTTGSHLYFDHYQSLSKHEPQAFGGYAPLKKVYNYKPVPKDLVSNYASLVLGVQGNVWTEYMTNPERVEYMTMPRMTALSEVAWQKPEKKDWQHFRVKMDRMINRYDIMGVNYAISAFRPDIQFNLNKATKNIEVTLEPELLADVYYTLDGTEPNPATSKKYSEPFILKNSTTVKAVAVKDGKVVAPAELKEAVMHKARGAKVIVTPEPTGKYKAQGGYTLVDTDFGGDKWGNGKWLGILGQDFTTTIELDSLTEVSKVVFSCIEQTNAGIYFPKSVEVAVSENGENFKSTATWNDSRESNIPGSNEIRTKNIALDFETTACKYLKIETKYHRIPNSGVFIFVDEIIVE